MQFPSASRERLMLAPSLSRSPRTVSSHSGSQVNQGQLSLAHLHTTYTVTHMDRERGREGM